MMHNDGMSQLDLLVKRFSPPLLEVSRDSREEPKLAPGERVQAHVLASLPNGRFQVLIKNQVLDMNLPANTQPGEQLDLSVVKNQPRLTFAFTRDLQQALPVLAPEVKLSDAAKYLGALLQRVEDAPDGTLKPALIQSPPLIAGAVNAPDGATLAQNLQQRLSQSGVFFESHQAEWVVGQRSLGQLLKEPQARMGQEPQSAVAQVQKGVSLPGAPAAEAIQEQMQAAPLDKNRIAPRLGLPGAPAAEAIQEQMQAAQLDNNRIAPGLGLPGAPAAEAVQEQVQAIPLDKNIAAPSLDQPARLVSNLQPSEQLQLRELVQQQLSLLDTRQLTWTGLAWPGQPLEWLVQERQADPGTGDGQTTVWFSRLKLDMPNLGEVVASVSLLPGGVQVHFQSTQETARLLHSQKSRLFDQLAAAGLNLLGASVNDEQ